MGTYLRQIHGPAMGCMQIEPATFEWLKTKYYNRFWRQIEPITFPELEWNLKASIVMARLRYLADPEPLPPAEDIAGLAKVWKRVYNTPLGAGTVDEFVRNHHTYCS
jgi:hypothetical protein